MQTATIEIDTSTLVQPGRETINDKEYLIDSKGKLVPASLVKVQHLLEDEVVRKIAGYAMPLAAQVARFREHTFEDVDTFVEVLRQDYDAPRGGQKGNLTLTTYDGLFKVQVQVADQIVTPEEWRVLDDVLDAMRRAGSMRWSS